MPALVIVAAGTQPAGAHLQGGRRLHRRGVELIPEAAPRDRLLPPAALAGGLAGALALAVSNVIIWFTRGPLGVLNDFYIYWSAAAVLNRGGNPYDATELARAHDAAGVPGILGGGYSYPLLFAQVLRPLALLPAPLAGAIFTVLSVLAVGLAVALLLGSIRGLGLRPAIPLGMLGGLFPPVSYGLWIGQANDILLPALALAYREVLPGAWLGLSAAVKLYPAAGFLAFAGRRDRWRQLALAVVLVGIPFVAAELLARGGGGAGPQVAGFLGADPYWSNQSINGALSRLALWPSGPLGGVSVEALDAVAITTLAVVVLVVLWRCRFRPWEGTLALLVWAGAVAAPKDSLWNYVPMLLCCAYALPHARRHPRVAAMMLAGFLMTAVQLVIWAVTFQSGTVPNASYRDILVVLTSSVGLYGAILIGIGTAMLLLAEKREVAEAATAAGYLPQPT